MRLQRPTGQYRIFKKILESTPLYVLYPSTRVYSSTYYAACRSVAMGSTSGSGALAAVASASAPACSNTKSSTRKLCIPLGRSTAHKMKLRTKFSRVSHG